MFLNQNNRKTLDIPQKCRILIVKLYNSSWYAKVFFSDITRLKDVRDALYFVANARPGLQPAKRTRIPCAERGNRVKIPDMSSPPPGIWMCCKYRAGLSEERGFRASSERKLVTGQLGRPKNCTENPFSTYMSQKTCKINLSQGIDLFCPCCKSDSLYAVAFLYLQKEICIRKIGKKSPIQAFI